MMTRYRLCRHLAILVLMKTQGVVGLNQDSLISVITDVNVVDVVGDSILPGRTVTIADGRIATVGTGPLPSSANPIDGSGLYLIPGLWDLHVHLRNPQAPTLLMPLYIAHGVTGVREMASSCDGPGRRCLTQFREWQRRVDDGTLVGPRLLALSSSPINPSWDAQLKEPETREMIRRFAEAGVDLIKTYYRLTPAAFGWITDEANRHGITVGGHVSLRMTAAEASTAGLRSLEHARDFLFDCFPGSTTFRQNARSQNPPIAVMRSMVDDHDAGTCDEAFRTLVRNDTWYVPTHVTRRMDAFADDPEFRNDTRARYIPSRQWDAWQADADRMVSLDPSPEGRRVFRAFYEKGLEITGRAHGAGVNIVLGTDAGDTYVFPGSSVHDELGELVKAGLTPAQALAAATIRAAVFLDRQVDHGTVEAGKHADLVLLGANPLVDIEHVRDIRAVFLGGRMFDRRDLNRMLSEVEAEVQRDPARR